MSAQIKLSYTRRPAIIAIEGNIGAGKSTLLEHLRQKFADSGILAVFMPEPVDIWSTIQDADGVPILTKFYADPEKYAFPFQVMAYSTRLATLRKTIAENPDCDVLVCERSLEADRNIFAKMLFADGMMEHMHHEVYQRLYHDTSAEFQMDAVVYLEVDPQKCMERVQLRNRGGENKISLEYLAKCHGYYEDWMQRLAEERTALLRLNTNADVRYETGDKGMDWVDEIYRFVAMLAVAKYELSITK